VWALIHVFPGAVVGLAIAFGGAHAPTLVFAAIGVLILAWLVWSMIKRKMASAVDASASQEAPRSCARQPVPWTISDLTKTKINPESRISSE
jgi:threonine/homoserine/homoserine lactone efflux protein